MDKRQIEHHLSSIYFMCQEFINLECLDYKTHPDIHTYNTGIFPAEI